LLYCDGQLVEIIEPSSFKVYWKGAATLNLKRVDISEKFCIADEILALLRPGHQSAPLKQALEALYYCEVDDNHVGILLVNGKFEKLLSPGSYGYWTYQRHIVVKHIDLRLQNIEVTGQEVLTKDRVSLRINLSATYCVEDPLKVFNSLSDFTDYLYRELQLQLREAIGTKTLDEILTDKDSLNHTMSEGVRAKLADLGITIKSVGVRDIILPGDMKLILNQVVEAQKAAEANLIKRREETAATRSLHNTAKVMEGNPTLMRLKELEVLEKVTERIGNINVYSGLDGVMNDLIKTRV